MENDVHLDPACSPAVPGTTVSALLRLGPCALASPGRILVIDDARSFAQGLARLLRRDGYTVETADTGQAALTQLQAHRYDVLVCDVRLPDLSGPDLYACMLRHYAYLSQRVIFLTGDTWGADTRGFLATCARPWLAKPCTAAAIRRAIQQVLDAGAPQR